MKKFRVNLKLARILLTNHGFKNPEIEQTSVPFLFSFVAADTLSHTVTIEEISA